MSIGKLRYIIDASIVENSVSDGLRDENGYYWKVGKSDSVTYQGKKAKFSNLSISDPTIDGTTITETISIKTTYFSEGIQYFFSQYGIVSQDTIIAELPMAFNTDYQDHYFQYFTPFNSVEQIGLSENTFTSNGDVEYEYAYYDASIEKLDGTLPPSKLKRKKTSFDLYNGIRKINNNSDSTNIFLSPAVLESMSDISDVATRNLPMYTNISFDTADLSGVSESLEDFGYMSSFMFQYLSYFTNQKFMSPSQFWTSSKVTKSDNSTTVDSVFSSYNITDFQNFLETFSTDSIILPQNVQIYDLDNSEKGFSGKNINMNLEAYLAKVVLYSKLNNLISDNLRSYKNMLSGVQSYASTMFYQIDKFENDNFIQTFYVPNTLAASINDIIDAQVRYNKKYRYTVYAHKIVIGSSYKYTDASYEPAADHVNITVETSPSFKMIRVPYFSYSGLIIDKPGISPDVQFVPYMNNASEILILLNAPIGQYEKNPVILSTSEISIIDEYRNQQKVPRGGNIEYKTDDPPYRFLVYRLEKRPNKITEFANGLRHQIGTSYFGKRGSETYSASIVDKIAANIKYYYLFRSVDAHGKISDISDVYEIQIINDGQSIYFISKVFVFEKDSSKNEQGDISGRRLLQIQPSNQQMLFDNSKISTYSSALDISRIEPLGVADDLTWGKKFKIRLTSKKTGRKVDYNVVFRQEFQRGET